MRLVHNVLTTLIARIIVLGLSLVSSILLARQLGPEGRGVFALTTILPGLATAVGALGFSEANVVLAGLTPDKRRALIWQSCVTALATGGVLAAAGGIYLALGAPGFEGIVRAPLLLYLVPLFTVPLLLLADYWNSVLRGMNRIVLMNAFEVGTKFVTVLLLGVFIGWLGLGVAGAVWSNFLTQSGLILLLLVTLGRVGILGKPTFDATLWRETWQFALPLYVGSIVVYLNYRVDEIIIARFLSPAELGYYEIAVGLVERLWLLTGAVSMPLLPHLTNTSHRDSRVAAIVARHVLVWTGAGCAVLFASADLVVRVLYSADYAPAVPPLRWLLPGIFTLSFGRVVVAELLVRKKPLLNLIAASVSTFVNVAANFALVPRLGITGAAIASSLSYTVLSAMIVWFYLRETGVPAATLFPRWSDLSEYKRLFLTRSADQSRAS